MTGIWRHLLVSVALAGAAAQGCAHADPSPATPAIESGGQERTFGPGFSVERPAAFRVAGDEDRVDARVARVLDAGGLAFLATDQLSEATAFVLPGGTPFPSRPDETFCEEMGQAFRKRGNTEDLVLTLDSTLGDGGCAVSFISTRGDGMRRRHRGLFFSARGQTWQLQTTANAKSGNQNHVAALEILMASWKFEPLPPVKTDAFSAPVPKGFHEAADSMAKETRQRGGVMWVAEQAPVAGIIVASISIAPALGVQPPVTEASCRAVMEPLKKTMRGIEVSSLPIGTSTTCRARGSDAAAPERQLSTTLVPVGKGAVWVLCRYHVVDDDAAEACEKIPASLTGPADAGVL